VVLNQKNAIKLLKEHGWTQSVGGKHSVKMCKEKHRPITLPKHKGRDYSKGLAASILREAGL
jgi:predicted RNA binding protein YcfA (HicA-like mRNA interferase family)